MLDRPIVGAEQVAHLCRIAGATQVFQQQRVEQCRLFIGGQGNLLSQSHADQASAGRVALRLSLGDVECIGKCRNRF